MTVKILHIINDLSLNGGAQRFLIDLVSPPPAGYEIKIITLEDTNEFRDTLDAQGVTYYAWNTLSLKAKWKLLRWPDVVHGHLFPSIYLALAAFGKKRVQTEHNSHNRRRDHIWMKPFEYLLYWRYHTTVCITQQVQEELEAFIPQWKSHYQVVFNGVDLSKFSLTAKQLPAADAPIRIGMVGRLHPYKDQPTLIRALALLPQRYELHFAGDGDRREEYQSLATSLGIEDRVFFHGIRSDIPDFLDGLDFYVQSSIIEGFGLAAVEAMAAGLPVLASRVPGIREVMDCEANMFDVGDSETLASMIANVCGDAATYQASTQRSIERCQLFTLSAFREQYYDVYQTLVDGKQRLANGKAS
ncbi:glycosyltransferase [Enterovibrio calviensis]|uniref:glycosyltransferase n=1 Tax=Enterovibrio calviensis TaxID=91359 RepID=UPI000489C868|nr:glycosyltransferase [Enterovibrio calviensis]